MERDIDDGHREARRAAVALGWFGPPQMALGEPEDKETRDIRLASLEWFDRFEARKKAQEE